MSGKTAKIYTVGEEIFNSVTHGICVVGSIVGASVLTTLAALSGEPLKVVAALVYGIALVLLFTMSTLYHAFPFVNVKSFFRILDHSSIYILIAASYTPYTLVLLAGNQSAFVTFWVVWGLAVLGIIVNAISIERFKWLSLALYVGMGWAAVFLLGDIIPALGSGGSVLMALGGLSYTGGIFFYVNKAKYMHSVWHLFVMAGAVLHYLSIAIYVY